MRVPSDRVLVRLLPSERSPRPAGYGARREGVRQARVVVVGRLVHEIGPGDLVLIRAFAPYAKRVRIGEIDLGRGLNAVKIGDVSTIHADEVLAVIDEDFS